MFLSKKNVFCMRKREPVVKEKKNPVGNEQLFQNVFSVELFCS